MSSGRPVHANILAGPDVQVIKMSRRDLVVESDVRLTPGAGICLNIAVGGANYLAGGRIAKVDATLSGGQVKYRAGVTLDSDMPTFEPADAAETDAEASPVDPAEDDARDAAPRQKLRKTAPRSAETARNELAEEVTTRTMPHRETEHRRPAAVRQRAGGAARQVRLSVLAVSDNSDLIVDLWTRLGVRGEFLVQIADTAQVARNAFATHPIDIAVVDLKMSDVQGFTLWAELAERQPAAHLVLLGTGRDDVEDALRACGHALPYRGHDNVPGICEAVRAAALPDAARADAIGPGIAAVLLESERETCTVSLKEGDRTGRLFFSNGAIADAESSHGSGEAVAAALLSWEKGRLTFEPGCPPDRTRLDVSAIALITRKTQSPPAPEPRPMRLDIPVTQEKKMALENFLQQLKEIKGYKASGIMHFTGDLLASDSVDDQINLAMVGATFNDIFRSAHEASKKIGLEACRETTINTPKGVIVMACSGTDSKAHIHLIGILSADGNYSLMRMQLAKMIPEIVGTLA